jgi:hypothetical protein
MTRKGIRLGLGAVGFAVLLGITASANAGVLTTVDDTDASDLGDALLAGGAGGITITNFINSFNTGSGTASTGVFSTTGTNNFGLIGTGIVISSGDAAQDGTSGPFIAAVTTDFFANATAGETNLLNQVSSAPGGWHDATEIDITFNAGPTTSKVFFNTVFTSAEYPVFVGEFVDGFGLFLNGTNIAFAGGDPVNINSPLMVNTAYPTDGGVDGSAFQTTPEGGVLVQGGSAVVTYSGAVTPGSTGNVLSFIIADANDNLLDTTAFIQGLGNAAPTNPVPEPGTVALLGVALAAMGFFGLQRGQRRFE